MDFYEALNQQDFQYIKKEAESFRKNQIEDYYEADDHEDLCNQLKGKCQNISREFVDYIVKKNSSITGKIVRTIYKGDVSDNYEGGLTHYISELTLNGKKYYVDLTAGQFSFDEDDSVLVTTK
jgi:hypothetical protein